MTTFEMKLIDFDLKYESKQTLRRIEKLRWLFKARSIKMVDLPFLGHVDMAMIIIYIHKDA